MKGVQSLLVAKDTIFVGKETRQSWFQKIPPSVGKDTKKGVLPFLVGKDTIFHPIRSPKRCPIIDGRQRYHIVPKDTRLSWFPKIPFSVGKDTKNGVLPFFVGKDTIYHPIQSLKM